MSCGDERAVVEGLASWLTSQGWAVRVVDRTDVDRGGWRGADAVTGVHDLREIANAE